MDEKILAIIEKAAEGEEALATVLKELSEDAGRAVLAALRLLTAFSDELPQEALRALAEAAGLEMEEEASSDEEPAEKAAGEEDTAVDPETATDVTDALLKSASEEMRPAIEALMKANAEAKERLGELEATLKAERDAKLLASETDRVGKAFGHVPGVEAGKLAELLIGLRKSDDAQADQVEELLKATEAAMVAKANGAFDEAGKTTPTSKAASGSDAWSQIQMKAEAIAKSEEISKAAAVDRVLSENPDLYSAYLAENTN